MSYCRFSSDDYQCDVYVYAHIAGYWTTHVASNRYAFQEPLPSQVSWVPGACNDDWFKRHEKVSQMVRKAKLVNIGLAHDGQTFDGQDANHREEYRRARSNRLADYH